jgi:hypothetical protein
MVILKLEDCGEELVGADAVEVEVSKEDGGSGATNVEVQVSGVDDVQGGSGHTKDDIGVA